MTDIDKFFDQQLSTWPLAAANFRALQESVRIKNLRIADLDVRLQFNPCRIASSTAAVDKDSIARRPCFLCTQNRPKEQYHIDFKSQKGRSYNIQVNPYPIFPGHLVIASSTHTAQQIWGNAQDMLDFSQRYPAYTVFYNGPQSGASAPDHLHFQACPRHQLPLENAVDAYLDAPSSQPIATLDDAGIYHFKGYARGVFAFKSQEIESLSNLFYKLLDCLQSPESEPKMNFFTYWSNGEFRAFVVLRSEFRSHHYFSTGPDHLTMSPGAADVAGFFIAPKTADFETVTSATLSEMIDEVTLTAADESTIIRRISRTQRTVDVGVLRGSTIRFELLSGATGVQQAVFDEGFILYEGKRYTELVFDAEPSKTMFAQPSFILYDVKIGIGFHWEQLKDQKFAGQLRIIVDGDKLVAVNRIGIEDYLLSVISSEMKASCPLESLKAHSVISRSWLLTNLGHHGVYDVCADDCCQRYQGLTMAVGDNVRKAIDQTWGQVLRYKGNICDARYSKCCGGKSEIFSTCWEDKDYPYLQSVADPYCDCKDKSILSLILNDYDLETLDFHDWEQKYSREEVSELFAERSGNNVGTILKLESLERGVSGRIKYLKVTGTHGDVVMGKELAIRRSLSTSHLKSSWFEASWEGDTLVLRGHGWGHGVGLCQIGAAVMAVGGFDYKQILQTYYVGAEIE